jgi:hypothetical protein
VRMEWCPCGRPIEPWARAVDAEFHWRELVDAGGHGYETGTTVGLFPVRVILSQLCIDCHLRPSSSAPRHNGCFLARLSFKPELPSNRIEAGYAGFENGS